ncbi:unnamed protein product, partial [Symbiodinium pilosum]
MPLKACVFRSPAYGYGSFTCTVPASEVTGAVFGRHPTHRRALPAARHTGIQQAPTGTCPAASCRIRVNTLYRYLACCLTFIDFMHAQHLSFALVPVALMVDFLHASSASKQQDRAVHRSSVNTAIKSLRWLAKHGQWHALSARVHNALVASYAKQIDSYDKKEAVPLPLALIVAWELVLCMHATPLTTKLVLGAALLCAHASICFGDAQRVKWGSIQLSTQGLHAVAYATKTTKRGQRFACTWHGISGRGPDSSRLLRWLSALAQLPRKLFETEGHTHEPDFFVPAPRHAVAYGIFLGPRQLRTRLVDPGLSQQAKLSSAEARALTLHSMKSTALALAAQLHLPREDRLSQGHHRDSAKLCSRNDTFASLRVQRHICAQVAQGWRPQRSMSRGGAAPVPEPPFTVPRQVPSTELPAPALLQGPWRIFTSRHETLHAAASTARQKPGADPPEVEPPLVVSGSDSEAEEVELFAQTAPDSDSEAQTKNNSCSVMTRACTHTFAVEYLLALPKLGSLSVSKLKASCGARCSIFFDFTSAPPCSLALLGKQLVLVPEPLQRALRDTGLCSVSDFAYAYLDPTDLSDFVTKQNQSLWEQLQVADPEHSPAVARLRRALDMSQSITRAQDACPASSAPAPSHSTAIATNVWAEHAPPRLDTEAVQRMQASFRSNYPGEHLDSDSTPSIRLLSLVHQWFTPKG